MKVSESKCSMDRVSIYVYVACAKGTNHERHGDPPNAIWIKVSIYMYVACARGTNPKRHEDPLNAGVGKTQKYVNHA